MAEDRFEKGREALFAALNVFFGNKDSDEVEPGEQSGRPSLEPPSLEPRPADREREPLLQLTPTSCSRRLSSVATVGYATVKEPALSHRLLAGEEWETPTRFFAACS